MWNSRVGVVLGLLVLVSLVQSIYITTINFEEVYSGPNGRVERDWDSKLDPTQFSGDISVAQFIITGTKNEEFYYTSVVEVFSAPKLKVISGEDIVDPLLFGAASEGYFFDGTSYWEELPQLDVYFNCQKTGRAILSITIESSLLETNSGVTTTTNETITFYFGKNCENKYGYRAGLLIGKDAVDDVVFHGAVQTKWAIESYYELYSDPVVIPEEEHLSVFHISISSPTYGNQYFYTPEVFVEDDDLVEVTVRGNAASGGIATGMPETLVLVYDCLDSGDTDITVTISLGALYEPLHFGFTKVCTTLDPEVHGTPGVINVGISRSDYAGVVSHSVTSLFWSVDSSSVEIPHDEIFTNFYISTLSGQTQEILKPIVTINPPTAFKVTLSGPLRDGGITTGAPQHLTINYICSRVAEAQVIVSLKLPGYKTVEFSYLKECKALKRHNDHVWTANQVMITFVICIVVIALAAFVIYNKKSQRRSSKPNLA